MSHETCPICRAPGLLWEVLWGIRLFREVAGRRVYRARCSTCGNVNVDGGKL